MRVLCHQTAPSALAQPSLVGDAWAPAVGPRVPATLAAPARALKACQRGRGLAPPHDLLRGVLAYVVGPLAPRRLGAWAVLAPATGRGTAGVAGVAGRARGMPCGSSPPRCPQRRPAQKAGRLRQQGETYGGH